MTLVLHKSKQLQSASQMEDLLAQHFSPWTTLESTSTLPTGPMGRQAYVSICHAGCPLPGSGGAAQVWCDRRPTGEASGSITDRKGRLQNAGAGSMERGRMKAPSSSKLRLGHLPPLLSSLKKTAQSRQLQSVDPGCPHSMLSPEIPESGKTLRDAFRKGAVGREAMAGGGKSESVSPSLFVSPADAEVLALGTATPEQRRNPDIIAPRTHASGFWKRGPHGDTLLNVFRCSFFFLTRKCKNTEKQKKITQRASLTSLSLISN